MTEPNIETNYPNIKESWGIIGISILLAVLFSIITKLLDNTTGKGFSFFIYYILAMGLSFGYAHYFRKKRTGISNYDFSLSSVKIIIFTCIATIAIGTGIIIPIISIIPIPEFMKQVFLNAGGEPGIFSFITVVIAAPLLEELIFRGIILDGLLKSYSPAKSIIISSFLFGICHLNPWQAIGAFILGVFSGWIYYKTKKLTLAILIHFTNNLFSFIGSYSSDKKTILNHSLVEIYGGVLNLLLITIGAILLAVFCIYTLRNEFKKRQIAAEV